MKDLDKVLRNLEVDITAEVLENWQGYIDDDGIVAIPYWDLFEKAFHRIVTLEDDPEVKNELCKMEEVLLEGLLDSSLFDSLEEEVKELMQEARLREKNILAYHGLSQKDFL